MFKLTHLRELLKPFLRKPVSLRALFIRCRNKTVWPSFLWIIYGRRVKNSQQKPKKFARKWTCVHNGRTLIGGFRMVSLWGLAPSNLFMKTPLCVSVSKLIHVERTFLSNAAWVGEVALPMPRWVCRGWVYERWSGKRVWFEEDISGEEMWSTMASMFPLSRSFHLFH